MILIVGLGNKGLMYRNTYHNIGFMVVDKLSEKLNIRFNHDISLSKVAMTKDRQIIVAKPETYMNLSGASVKALIKKFKLNLDDILIVYDDIDLPKGRIRVRDSGSAGTHNGMRNIVATLESDKFLRLRIGIGRDESVDLSDYVLSRIKQEDIKILGEAVEIAVERIIDYIGKKDKEHLLREK